MTDQPVKRGRGRPPKVRTPEEQEAEEKRSYRRQFRQKYPDSPFIKDTEFIDAVGYGVKMLTLLDREGPHTPEEYSQIKEWLASMNGESDEEDNP